MRTVTTAEAQLLYSRQRTARTQVLVYDRLGAGEVDLTAHQGVNWVLGWEVSDSSDSPVGTATVRLRREFSDMSLVPGRVSYANQPNGGGAARNVLQLGGVIKVLAELVPPDERLDGAAAHLLFHGQIDRVDVGGGAEGTISLACRDLGARLMDEYSLEERPRKGGVTTGWGDTVVAWPMALQTLLAGILDAVVAPDVWSAGATVTAGSATALPTITQPTVGNGYFYRCTTSGTTHAVTQPTWPTTLGATVADNTAVWTCVGELPAIYTPTSPAWNVNNPTVLVPQQQAVKKGPLLDQLRQFAAQIDWEVRYRFDDGTSAWRLTLYDPVDAAPASAFNLAPSFYEVGEFHKDFAGVRNIVVVTYGIAADGQRLQKFARDATSETAYGQRRCELVEAGNTNVDGAAEAQRLANSVLAALREPWWEGTVTVPLFPHAQIKDTFTLQAPNHYFDANQTLGVIGIRHTLDTGGAARTTFTVREVRASYSLHAIYVGRIFRRVVAPSTAPPVSFLRPEVAFARAFPNDGQALAVSAKATVALVNIPRNLGGDFGVTPDTYIAPLAGLYLITASVAVRKATVSGGGSLPAGTQIDLWVEVNAVRKRNASKVVSALEASDNIPTHVAIATTLQLAAGDDVTLSAAQDNEEFQGEIVGADTQFTAFRLPG